MISVSLLLMYTIIKMTKIANNSPTPVATPAIIPMHAAPNSDDTTTESVVAPRTSIKMNECKRPYNTLSNLVALMISRCKMILHPVSLSLNPTIRE